MADKKKKKFHIPSNRELRLQEFDGDFFADDGVPTEPDRTHPAASQKIQDAIPTPKVDFRAVTIAK